MWYKILKFKTIYKDKKIVFYGAGLFAQELFENFNFSDLNILGVVDRDYCKKGTKIANYEIFFFDELETFNPDIIVSTVMTLPHLFLQLKLNGTRELIIPNTSYIGVYWVKSNNVEVLRILHTSMKWPDNFDG